MKINNLQLWGGLVAIFICLPAMVSAAKPEDVAEGGRYYDKWWLDTDLPEPKETHPAYPVTAKKKGSTTWRCKECHGWDYRGRDGAYGSGSHYTGIGGIRAYADADPTAVLAILVNATHQYDKVLPSTVLNRLSLFVALGQLDMSQYIDPQTREVNGNDNKGEAVYEDNCAKCHGRNGREMNLAHDADKTEYVGTIARNNPWEVLHKIRNGQPDSEMSVHHMGGRSGMGMRNIMGGMRETMPAMITRIGERRQIDLLAYLQTLPKD